VEDAVAFLDFDTFEELGNYHMRATVERAVEVIATALSVLSADVTGA
jgi:hypothetical protein